MRGIRKTKEPSKNEYVLKSMSLRNSLLATPYTNDDEYDIEYFLDGLMGCEYRMFQSTLQPMDTTSFDMLSKKMDYRGG